MNTLNLEKDKNTVYKTLNELETKLREGSADYYHSGTLAKYTADGNEVNIDLRGMLLCSAIVGLPVLLTGSTGGGKTTIARKAAKSFFGDYAMLQMDSSFNMDKLRDVSFKKIKEGGLLSEAVSPTKLVTSPVAIIDEYNRAPTEITNIIQGYLENGKLSFEGGAETETGIDDKEGGRYQWKIATANEGSKYHGARKMDKASRNRLAVEIDLDVFPLAENDRRNLISKGRAKTQDKGGEDRTQDILALKKYACDIPLHWEAEEFLAYLMRMDQCIESPEGTKNTINVNERLKGSHHLALDSGIYSAVSAPSARSISHARELSQAFALYRASKTGAKEEVLLDDVMAAAPFVTYSKMDVEDGWVAKRAGTSKWNAVNEVLKLSYQRMQRGYKKNLEIMKKLGSGKALEEAELSALREYVEKEDPWFMDFRDIGYIPGKRAVKKD